MSLALRGTFEVIVATFGSNEWARRGDKAAGDIETGQSFRVGKTWHVTKVTRVHLATGTLAQARNLGAAHARGNWLIFLDADDALSPDYVNAMYRAAFALKGAENAAQGHGGALLTPQVQHVRYGRPGRTRFMPEVAVEDGNWMVIGTAVSRRSFYEVGGFDEYPMYEDWALFARMQMAGDAPVRVPEAVYVANRKNASRNDAPRDQRVYWHQRIGHDLWPDLYDATTPVEDERMILLRPDGRRALLSVRRLAA